MNSEEKIPPRHFISEYNQNKAQIEGLILKSELNILKEKKKKNFLLELYPCIKYLLNVFLNVLEQYFPSTFNQYKVNLNRLKSNPFSSSSTPFSLIQIINLEICNQLQDLKNNQGNEIYLSILKSNLNSFLLKLFKDSEKVENYLFQTYHQTIHQNTNTNKKNNNNNEFMVDFTNVDMFLDFHKREIGNFLKETNFLNKFRNWVKKCKSEAMISQSTIYTNIIINVIQTTLFKILIFDLILKSPEISIVMEQERKDQKDKSKEEKQAQQTLHTSYRTCIDLNHLKYYLIPEKILYQKEERIPKNRVKKKTKFFIVFILLFP